MNNSIQQRYTQINERIANCCNRIGRDPSEITLIAVSKTKPDENVLDLLDVGQRHFGENRVKALENRMTTIDTPSAVWHYIGNLQTNKIKYLAPRVDWIQSIHKKKALKEVEKRASEYNRTINVLIQVNISSEDQKSGCPPDKLEQILTYAKTLQNTKVMGLMGMATFTDDADQIRSEFRLLKSLKEKYQHLNSGSLQLKHVSMGMTNDLEIAAGEGSTMVRVGTAIFGKRNY